MEIWKISLGVKCSSDGCLSLVYINRYSHNLREALAARFIPKGIPEPPCVRRVEDTDSHAFLFIRWIVSLPTLIY